jgi:plasmid stabilization system protein ParE
VRLAVEFHPDATADLLAATDWTEGRRPGSGAALLSALNKALERIALWPESGIPEAAVLGEAPIRSARLAGTRYRAVYLIIEQTLWVVAVAHDRQKPGFWQDRVDDSQRP